MKRIVTLALAVLLVASMTTVAFAAESTTTLSTTVPAASYTLNIPANQDVPFGTTRLSLGNVTVTDSAGFADGKNLNVTISYDAFSANGISTTIPYALSFSAQNSHYKDIASGDMVTFYGKADGTVEEIYQVGENYPAMCLLFTADSKDWGKALAGDYTSTITFTTEVVAGE